VCFTVPLHFITEICLHTQNLSKEFLYASLSIYTFIYRSHREDVLIDKYLKFYELSYLMLLQQFFKAFPDVSRLDSQMVVVDSKERNSVKQSKRKPCSGTTCTIRRQHYLPRIVGNFFTISTV